jgi:IPT/TIG domain-containing protein
VAIATPIGADAVVGSQFPLSIDLANSFWLDAFGQPYPQEIKPGTLTIGGTINISNVVPGGGFQPAGATVSIFGMGFTVDARVAMEGVNLTTTDYQVVSPNQIDVILPDGLRMDGVRVRVKNKIGETAQYFSYLRAQPLGQSGNALVNRCYPLFSRTTYTSASLAWTRNATTFTALAAQNPRASSADITVEMLSATNQVMGSFTFPLPPTSKITRDLTDFFAQAPVDAVSVHVTSTQRVQLLGLLGDTAAGAVVPVIVSVP